MPFWARLSPKPPLSPGFYAHVPSDVLQIISTSDFKRKTRDSGPKLKQTGREVKTRDFSGHSLGLSAKLLAKKDTRRGHSVFSIHQSAFYCRSWDFWGPLMAFLCKLLSAFFVAVQTKDKSAALDWDTRQTGTL